MAAFSGDIDSALIAKLLADATLTALMPEGVWYDIAAAGKRRFVIVKLMTHTVTRMFNGRANEAPVYLVKAVTFWSESESSTTSNMVHVKNAGARIDVLLDGANGEGGTVTVPGYGIAQTALDEYVRYVESDLSNADARWHHRGGMYSVFAVPQ